jgi:hypothetical protein
LKFLGLESSSAWHFLETQSSPARPGSTENCDIFGKFEKLRRFLHLCALARKRRDPGGSRKCQSPHAMACYALRQGTLHTTPCRDMLARTSVRHAIQCEVVLLCGRQHPLLPPCAGSCTGSRPGPARLSSVRPEQCQASARLVLGWTGPSSERLGQVVWWVSP